MKGISRLLTLILLLLPAAVGVWGQQASYNLKFQLSKKHFADSIGIDFSEGRVVVPVEIGGRSYRFMLDTGAAQAIVYDNSGIEGCRTVGHIKSYDAIGRLDTVPMVVLPPLTLGSLTLTGLQATLHHRPTTNRSFDGIIGFDLVCKGLSMKIDTRAGLLILTDERKLLNREDGLESRYVLNPYMHTPYLKLMPFRDFADEALFDTGSRSIYVPSAKSFSRGELACRVQRAGQIEGRARTSYAIGLHGREADDVVTYLCIDSLLWGGFAFRQLHTHTTQGNSHLGAGVLGYGAVTFLPHRKTVRFQPYNGDRMATVGNPQIDKAIVAQDGKPVAQFVWQHGEAYKAGLREGDVILKIGRQPVDTYDDYARFRHLRGMTYVFRVRDVRGIEKEVSMKW